MQITSPRLWPVPLAGIWNEKGQDAGVGSMHAGTNKEKNPYRCIKEEH